MDAFTHKRVSALRDEIASLDQENRVYDSQTRHNQGESAAHNRRHERLTRIRQELLTLLQVVPKQFL